VFVGVVGGDDHRIEQQVQLLLQEQEVRATLMMPAAVRTLSHRADGVVGGELVVLRGHQTLRLVVYDGDGGLKSLSEIPLSSGRLLTRDELVVLRTNLEDEVTALVARKKTDKKPTEARVASPGPRRAKS
jgi:hypothetical protein